MINLILVAHFLTAVAGMIVVVALARFRRLPDGVSSNAVPRIWALGLMALTVAIFELASFKASTPPDRFWDFLNAYYPAGQAMLHHERDILRALIEKGTSGFVNIPVMAYLFAPFGLLRPWMAVGVFTAIGLALTVATWILLARLANLEIRERWLLALLFLVNGPLMNAVKLGNTSYFVLFALAAGVALLRAQRSSYAGCLLGMAAMMKPPLLLFGLYFALRRDWRGTLAFAAVCVGTASLSLFLFGWEYNIFWFRTAILQYSNSWLAAFCVQSIPALLFRLHSSSDILLDWLPHVPAPGERLASHALTALLFVIAGAACVLRSRRAAAQSMVDTNEQRELQYLLVICLCLVSSPLSWSHYYAWLLVPIAFFLGSPKTFSTSKATKIVAWAAIGLVTPLVEWPLSISQSSVTTLYTSFGVSHLLFGGLLWFGLVAWWLAKPGQLPSPLVTKPSIRIPSMPIKS